MSTDFELWRQWLERRDEFAAIEDGPLEEIRGRVKTELVHALRSGLDAISRLPAANPAQERRRRAEAEWWASILSTWDAPQ